MMKRTLIFLIVMFSMNIDFAFADWPHLVRCLNSTSVAEPAGSSYVRNGFTTYSSRSDGPYPAKKFIAAKKFIGADIKNYNTFSCYYEVSDGTHIAMKFTISKCQPTVGFDISGKCNNSDPVQCAVICAY